jgi:hypothetical protein
VNRVKDHPITSSGTHISINISENDRCIEYSEQSLVVTKTAEMHSELNIHPPLHQHL